MAFPAPPKTPEGIAGGRSATFGSYLFRFAVAVAILSFPRLAIFISPHLWFDSLRRPVALATSRWDILERQPTTAIGAFIIRTLTGGHASIPEMTAKFKTDWFAAAIPDSIGLLTLAALMAALWTALDRQRTHYPTLNRWMRAYLRYGVATAMLSYAFVKVIPTQFGYLTPGELLQPLGKLSRFQVLWDFMAVSTAYTAFTGLIELAGAVLLFFPRTTLLGAIVLAGALINVIALDLAYGVGAVTYAFALLLLDIVILAPYLKPLFEILLVRGAGPLPSEPSVPRHRWWHSPAAKVVLVCILALPLIAINVQRRRLFFGSGHLVYGLFDVASFSRNGHAITPLAGDSAAWKRVASDPRNGVDGISVQFANGDVRHFQLTDDSVHHVWTIREEHPSQAGALSYGIRPDGSVSLNGRIGDDSVDILLRPVDLNKEFPLLRPAG